MKIAFLGDISFNDKYIQLYEDGVNPFKNIEKKLSECDFVIGNLECISEGDEGENELKKPRLKTKTKTLNYLKNLNISAVTLAHNHIYDNLKDGFLKTTSFLDSNKIEHIGVGISEQEAQKPLLIEKAGMKISFLSYVHEDTNPNLPKDCPLHLNIYKQEKIIDEIIRFKKEGLFVVLLLHWGGRFEGGKYPDKYQQKHAKSFIKAGADLIIGHHSHTLQATQKILGKHVFYSLGNFCFADIIFEGKVRNMSKIRFCESLIPIIQIRKDSEYSIELFPIKNRALEIIEDKTVLLKLRWRSLIQNLFNYFSPFWLLYLFHFKIIIPIWQQLSRKDADKSIIQRIFSLNFKKIKSLLIK